MGTVRVGCSGWQYGDWRGIVYPLGLPQRDWLARYAQSFATVEVNATHYRLPSRDAVARWVEQVPADFEFAVKVSRFLTHMKRLTTVADGMGRLLERLEPMVAAGRLGPLLWQLPERFHRDDERLAGALDELPLELTHAFELRHPSWFADEVWELLRAHGVATVIGHDARRPLPDPPPTAPLAYVRLHYGAAGRRGNYSAAELERWADRIAALAAAGHDVVCYLNNDWEGFAPRNALALERALRARGV